MKDTGGFNPLLSGRQAALASPSFALAGSVLRVHRANPPSEPVH